MIKNLAIAWWFPQLVSISMLIVKSENCGLLGRHFLIKRSWFSAYFSCLRRYFEIFAKKTFKSI